MTDEVEERYLGMEVDHVPKTDADNECNGKKVEKTDDDERLFAGYCSLPAGWGVVEGGEYGRRCKLHGGFSSGGAPESNQNASKHGLNADPHHYYQSLSPDQKEWIEEVAAVIEDRVRENTGEVDKIDRLLSRRVAIELHIVSKAFTYVERESGLVQEITSENSIEKVAPLLKKIRRYDNSIFKNLKELGVFDDPEPQTVDPVESWRGFIEGEQDF